MVFFLFFTTWSPLNNFTGVVLHKKWFSLNVENARNKFNSKCLIISTFLQTCKTQLQSGLPPCYCNFFGLYLCNVFPWIVPSENATSASTGKHTGRAQHHITTRVKFFRGIVHHCLTHPGILNPAWAELYGQANFVYAWNITNTFYVSEGLYRIFL